MVLVSRMPVAAYRLIGSFSGLRLSLEFLPEAANLQENTRCTGLWYAVFPLC
jgi:hypothetical protein